MRINSIFCLLCSEVGQNQDLNLHRNHYEGIVRSSSWNFAQRLSTFHSWLLLTFKAKTCSFQKMFGFKMSKMIKVIRKWRTYAMIPTNIRPSNQQILPLLMRFMLPNSRIMNKKDYSFRIYQNHKISGWPRSHILSHIIILVGATVLGFVMQGHIWSQWALNTAPSMSILTRYKKLL